MKKINWPVVLALPLLVFAIACAVPSNSDGDPIKKDGAGASGLVATPAAYSIPTPDDFTLTLTELSRKCFGSAGCNVTFTVQLTAKNTTQYDPKKTYKVTYSITGADDAYTNYLTINGTKYSHNDEEFVGVKNKDTKLVSTITQIIEA